MATFLDYVEGLGIFGEDAERLQDMTIVLDAAVFFAAHKQRMKQTPARHNYYMGGSYPWLADTVTKVITNLRDNDNGVTPIVVDGLSNIYRYAGQVHVQASLQQPATDIEMIQDPNKDSPFAFQFPLLHTVIASVLRELNVETVVPDFGRHRTMATIANELGCPVLTGSSRLLRYPVRRGVLFIGGEQYREYESRLYSGPGVLARRWNYKNFMDHHRINEEQYSHIFATDELYPSAMEEDRDKRRSNFYQDLVKAVQNFPSKTIQDFVKLSRYSGYDGRTQFQELLTKYQEVAAENTMVMIKYLRSNEFNRYQTKGGKFLPIKYRELMRGNLFPISYWMMLMKRHVLFKIFEEDITIMESAKHCSHPIRQFGYALLFKFDRSETGSPSGDEYFQKEGEHDRYRTETDGLLAVSLDQVPSLTEDARCRILLKALGVEPKVEAEFSRDSSLLLAAVIQFWVKNCQPGKAHQRAINHSFVNYRLDQLTEPRFTTTEICPDSRVQLRKILHPFAQFSSILQDAMDLSSVLLNPCGEIKIQEVFDVPYLLHRVLVERGDNE